MSYREDLKANFNVNEDGYSTDNLEKLLATTNTTIQDAGLAEAFKSLISIVLDMIDDKALDRQLKDKRNLYEHRYLVAYKAYKELHPDVEQTDITLDELDKIDPGIKEEHRQLYSEEQGTSSGKTRDIKRKILNHLEQIVIITEK